MKPVVAARVEEWLVTEVQHGEAFMSSSGTARGSDDRKGIYDFYAKVDDRDYWELGYLKLLNPDDFRAGSKACLVLAVLTAAVLVGILATGDEWVKLASSLGALVTVLVALALSLLTHVQATRLDHAIDYDERAGRMETRELAERVRRFALRQEQEFSFLLQIEAYQPASGVSRQDWALDHARAITTEWPKDFAEYQELQASVDYQRVRSYLFNKPGHVQGEGTVLFEQIMNSRQDMWDRVQRSLKRERAATAIERDKTIGIHEETTRAEINEVAEQFKKGRPDDEDD